MKKQFILTAVIILIGLCFCSLNDDNNIKACGTTVANCPSVIKSRVVIDESTREKIENYIPSGYAEETDAPYNMFMNPFTHL